MTFEVVKLIVDIREAKEGCIVVKEVKCGLVQIVDAKSSLIGDDKIDSFMTEDVVHFLVILHCVPVHKPLPTPPVWANFAEVLAKLGSVSGVQSNLCWLVITHDQVTVAFITRINIAYQRF